MFQMLEILLIDPLHIVQYTVSSAKLCQPQTTCAVKSIKNIETLVTADIMGLLAVMSMHDMLSIACVGLSTRTTGENCEKELSKSLPFEDSLTIDFCKNSS